MNQLQMRLEVQGAVQSWIDSFMMNNGVSATMMEDALSKALVSLKDKAIQEFIIAASVPASEDTPIQETEKDD